MTKKAKIILGGCIAFSLAVVAAAIVWKTKVAPAKYVATGTFYYWHHGMEMTAGRGCWGGPDPLACFKTDLWDKRPRDFKWSVWNKFRDVRGWTDDAKPEFARAYDSVMFSGNHTAFTWKNIYAVSSDPAVAADVANAYMDALADLELELLLTRNRRRAEWLTALHFRDCRQRKQLAKAAPELEKLDRSIAKREAEIDALERCDVRTNTMFKIMKRAEVPTKADVPSEGRMRECRAYFDGLNVPPF